MKDRERNVTIANRIVRECNVPDLVEVLSERISPTDLQSLLLEVYHRRSSRLTPAAVLKQYRENRFVRPAQISSVESGEFDRLAFSLLPEGFEILELSPVSPLASCSVLATVDQNNVVSDAFDGGRAEVLEQRIMAPLRPRHPEATFELDEERQTGRGYYRWAAFQVNVKDPEGHEWFLIDGGFTDWTEKLMSDRKEKLLISGMGTERFLVCFRPRRSE